MRAPSSPLARLLVCLGLLSGAAFALDKVVMREDGSQEGTTHTGRVIAVLADQEKPELVLKFEHTTTRLELDSIESAEIASDDCRAQWEAYLASRRGARAPDGGDGGDPGRGGGLEEEGKGESSGPIEVTPAETKAIAELVGRLGEADELVESELLVFGYKATLQLTAELASGTDRVREDACRLLGLIGHRNSIDPLLRRVDDSSGAVRREAVHALYLIDRRNERVAQALLEHGRKELDPAVMKAIAIAVAETAKLDQELVKRLFADSRDAPEGTRVYYEACLAMCGDNRVGDNLERWLRLGLRDDVFLATCLAGIPGRGEAATRYLLGQLRRARNDERRTAEIVAGLRKITEKNFGYLEVTNLAERVAAVEKWHTWWAGADK